MSRSAATEPPKPEPTTITSASRAAARAVVGPGDDDGVAGRGSLTRLVSVLRTADRAHGDAAARRGGRDEHDDGRVTIG
ncbi:hypothetical protein GCM10009774_05520 [Cellulomonas gelida]|uniref:Uncharacterized protein n=1 Tax=Cellulomonas gelida TaxID=1712 RepID=A0A4Y3KN02_9CELL|nr:hypothetical protein CGE01nite_17760 [Cellulomonas gelida]GGL18105.1 hypothetical protein GCM10009774_05520 [Cellulomonas gelida]